MTARRAGRLTGRRGSSVGWARNNDNGITWLSSGPGRVMVGGCRHKPTRPSRVTRTATHISWGRRRFVPHKPEPCCPPKGGHFTYWNDWGDQQVSAAKGREGLRRSEGGGEGTEGGDRERGRG
jgi:hypothetical protein